MYLENLMINIMKVILIGIQTESMQAMYVSSAVVQPIKVVEQRSLRTNLLLKIKLCKIGKKKKKNLK